MSVPAPGNQFDKKASRHQLSDFRNWVHLHWGFIIATTLILSFLILFGAGCTSSTKYLLSKSGPTPPIPFEIEATATQETEATLHTVILCRGPGSWKEKALWDEYVLTVNNLSELPVTILEARLIDLQETPQNPGIDPWELEKQSAENWKHYAEAGLHLAAGTLGAAGAASLFAFEYALLGSSTGGVLLAIVPVVVVVTAWDSKTTNAQNKQSVEAEFDRRRLKLPITISGKATASGCLFFPQCPGPITLNLVCERENRQFDLSFDLANSALATLHISEDEEAQ